MTGDRPNGTLIVLAFAIALGLGITMVVLYKTHEASLPPASASFQRVDAAPANATVHELDFRAVHTQYQDSFLEDHLNTALDHGASSETERLRVQQMRATVIGITDVHDDVLFVGWEGKVVRVEFSGVP